MALDSVTFWGAPMPSGYWLAGDRAFLRYCKSWVKLMEVSGPAFSLMPNLHIAATGFGRSEFGGQ